MFFSQSFWKKPLLRLNTHNKSGLLDWKCSKTPWKVVTFSEVEILFWMAFKEASTIKSSSLYSGVFTNSKLILVLKENSIKNIILPVSAPFHGSLMSKATNIMNEELNKLINNSYPDGDSASGVVLLVNGKVVAGEATEIN